MFRLFGRKKNEEKVTLEQAAEKANARSDTLDERIAKLDAELARYKQQLSRMRDGPAKGAVRQRAMRVLRMRKQYEAQRDSLQQQGFNMEQVTFAQQSLRDTATTVAAMKEAGAQLKKQFKEIKISKIEDMQDDLADLMEDANEVQEVLGRSYGLPDDVDEEDLDAELDALADDLLTDDALGDGADAVPSYLKERPKGVAAGAAGDGDDDILKLPRVPERADAAPGAAARQPTAPLYNTYTQ